MSENLTCGECGIVFGVPEAWVKARREDSVGFFCPNGHPRVFRKSTTDKLREELSAERQAKARLEDELREARRLEVRLRDERRKAVAETKRVSTRAKAALCPCCNRSFAQLAKHMQSKHPEALPARGRIKAEAVQ